MLQVSTMIYMHLTCSTLIRSTEMVDWGIFNQYKYNMRVIDYFNNADPEKVIKMYIELFVEEFGHDDRKWGTIENYMKYKDILQREDDPDCHEIEVKYIYRIDEDDWNLYCGYHEPIQKFGCIDDNNIKSGCEVKVISREEPDINNVTMHIYDEILMQRELR
jgi:hypothetical protein